jgi:hypothetical protein
MGMTIPGRSSPVKGEFKIKHTRRNIMPVFRDDDPLVERQVVEEPVDERLAVRQPVVERRVVRRIASRGSLRDRGEDLTTYAFIKYAFILAITIVILYFIARVLLPSFT